MGGVTFGANTSEPSDVILTDFNSVLVYDIVSNTAATVTTFGDIPPHRLGYSTVNGPDNRSIVMFGGYIAGENQTHTAVDADIYVLDTCTLAWSKKSIKGNAPPGMFGHGAVNINNYMVVIMGKKDDNNYNRLVYILDMNNWKWVTSVDAKSLMDTKTTSISECKFNLPNVTDTTFVQFNYDLSVLQNPLAPTKDDDKSKKEGFGIGFGLFALILIGLGLYYYYRRISRRKASFLNPRWMRTMSSSRKGDGRDYPLFVYNKELDSNNPNNPYRPTPAAAFASHNVKTYTASDHEQWEQQINSDIHNDKNRISQDIWKRMRSLSNDEETATQTSHSQTRKILDA
ncbi:hypothetical protein G6F37_007482 [Rhizopus arrhizus]|nr:hypothetical protein G6F38_006011 [Rhizopus arrhizus]KAG1156577.1 hypothetical protein G6F37_007482 [Rhizopus arrhizus]